MVKKFSLRKEYSDAWKYIKQSKEYIYFTISLFFLFAVVGFFITPPQMVSEKILEFIKAILEQTKDLSGGELISYILLNNIKSSFFGFLFGIFFGLFPIIAILSNGYLLGYVGATSVKVDGLISLWRIFPHGIFELPALFLALGLGIKFGSVFLKKDVKKTFLNYLIESLRVFLLVIVPLLIIAAIIEGILIIGIK